MNVFMKFLKSEINPNINWKEVISEYYNYIDNINEYGKDEKITKKLIKMLKKIKSLSWMDKPPGEDSDYIDKTNIYIEQFTQILLNNDYDKNKVISVLYCDFNKTLPRYFFEKYTKEIKILKKLFKIFGYKYIITDNVNELNKADYIIPLTSLLLTSAEEIAKIDYTKIIHPTIHDWNIILVYYSPEDLKIIFDNIHLIINYLENNDLSKYEYNYLFVEKNKNN